MPAEPAVELRVQIEPTLSGVVPDAISFETGASREQAANPDLFVYEHHGKEFGWADPGALSCFFEDLILGRPFPLTFATTWIHDVDVIVAIALFLQRELAIHPATPGFVAAVDLFHRRGPAMLGHIDADLGRFLAHLQAQFPSKGVSRRELGDRLKTAVSWIRDYIVDGQLPDLRFAPSDVRVLKQGTNGFVLAEASGPLLDAWIDLYRQGFLRGLVISPEVDGRRHMLGARKSHYVSMDFPVLTRLLNEIERSMGELPEWREDGLWLYSPSEGSSVLVSHVLELLLRV